MALKSSRCGCPSDEKNTRKNLVAVLLMIFASAQQISTFIFAESIRHLKLASGIAPTSRLQLANTRLGPDSGDLGTSSEMKCHCLSLEFDVNDDLQLHLFADITRLRRTPAILLVKPPRAVRRVSGKQVRSLLDFAARSSGSFRGGACPLGPGAQRNYFHLTPSIQYEYLHTGSSHVKCILLAAPVAPYLVQLQS